MLYSIHCDGYYLDKQQGGAQVLVLARKAGQSIILEISAEPVEIVLTRVKGNQGSLAIIMPNDKYQESAKVLVPDRTVGESVILMMFGERVEILLTEIKGDQARLGFNAPKCIPIYRKEIYEEILAERARVALSQKRKSA